MNGLIRVFVEKNFTNEFEIVDENFHYLKNVRRIKEKNHIVLMNKHNIAEYEVRSINKKSINLKLINIEGMEKPDYELILYQAVLKREYMDYVVEKAGEIGVTKLVPVITSRSISCIKNKTLNRYEKLLIKGAMQAEHSFVPEIVKPLNIEDIENNDFDLYVFFERKDNKNIPKLKNRKISMFIGPEGGISNKEILLLKEKGADIVSPISSILKAETASVIFTGMIKSILDCS